MNIILPGEVIELKSDNVKISEEYFSQIPNKPLLAVAKKSGIVLAKLTKNTNITKVSLQSPNEKYIPKKDDRVIGIITKRQGEAYNLNIGADKESVLGILEFDGASKRSKPSLEVGDIVYCRVVSINKYLPYKLSCKCPSNKKDWASGDATYSQLKDGLEIDVSTRFVKKLLNDSTIFDALKKYISFEVALGVNNKIWVSTKIIQNLILLKSY